MQDCSFDEAAKELVYVLQQVRKNSTNHPGLQAWAKRWQRDHSADGHASEILADAMSRYLDHLRSQGASPRVLSGVLSDLDLYGGFLFSYESPKGKGVLSSLVSLFEYEFSRKVSDSPPLVSRYLRTVRGFHRYLKKP